MKRTFIAVKIEAGDKLREAISDLRSELRDDSIKWVDLNNIHITIAFLGNTSDEDIEKVSLMLERKCTGSGTLGFSIAGVGVFRSLSDLRVIWAGIEDPGSLAEMHIIVKAGLNDSGIRIEERTFNPHLTLGRVKRVKDKRIIETLLERYRNVIFQEVTISEVIFFESILSQNGPDYIPIISFNLQRRTPGLSQ